MNWFASHDLILYIDIFTFKTGSQGDRVRGVGHRHYRGHLIGGTQD